MRNAALRLIALSSLMPVSLSLSPFLPSFSSCLALSLYLSLSPSFILFSTISSIVLPTLSLSASFSCISFFANLSGGLSVTPSILLSYFASCFSSLFVLSLICPHAPFVLVYHLQMCVPLGIHSLKSLFWHCCRFILSPALHPPVCLDFCLTLFLWHIEFSAADALKRTRQTGVQGREIKKDVDIYILCMLVNKALASLSLMQCSSMHMVPGGAGHVWFIWCIPTRRQRDFMLHSIYLYSPVEEFVVSHLSIGWQQGWQTDPLVHGCFFTPMADVAIWHGSCTCSLKESTFLSFIQMQSLHTSCKSTASATSKDFLVSSVHNQSIYLVTYLARIYFPLVRNVHG